MGHHSVPQRYLRGFEDAKAPGSIWMYDKVQNTCKLVSISKVLQQARSYEEDEETELNHQVEIPGNDVIDKLGRREPIDEMDRRHLTYYIATMVARVPAARERAKGFIPSALAETTQKTKELIREMSRTGQITEERMNARLAEADAVHAKFIKQPPEEVTKVIKRPWPYESWLLHIHSMTWRILRCEGALCFLTSDNPIHFLGGEGLGRRTCELTFPLSSKLLLHCSWQGDFDTQVLACPPNFVKEFNCRTAFGASRFLFYPHKSRWVMKAMADKQPKLNRINW